MFFVQSLNDNNEIVYFDCGDLLSTDTSVACKGVVDAGAREGASG